MPTRKAQAKWQGTLQQGKGSLELGSGAFKGDYSFDSRFENSPGTNPEELIGAAHAGCFSMALSMLLEKAGHAPQEIRTRADVKIEKVDEGFKITQISLQTEAEVPGIEPEEFQKQAQDAKEGCPVSQALAGTQIELTAELRNR